MTEPPGAFPPPPMPPAAPPVPGPPRTAWYARPVPVGLAGLLLGAAMIGVPWLLTRDDTPATGGQGSLTGGSTAALSAPEKLGDFMHQDTAMKGLGADEDKEKAEKNAEVYVTADRRSSGLLSTAYGGAPAVVQGFADAKFENQFQLTAVRARSPRPFVAYEDPAHVGLVKPQNEMTSFGKVDCVIYNAPTNSGGTPASDSVSVISCQRTGDGLTVQIRQVSGDVGHVPRRVAGLVDQAWTALS
ncbi:hypothetical protein AB5J56_30715 [Streptomyces sp. R21]|uniref:PknH-like extracellular domain-containing protein n=1 Tax=Streptomyces sp. R21 TaxID=3238627 RepID=A0AB39PIE1_9ACTN